MLLWRRWTGLGVFGVADFHLLGSHNSMIGHNAMLGRFLPSTCLSQIDHDHRSAFDHLPSNHRLTIHRPSTLHIIRYKSVSGLIIYNLLVFNNHRKQALFLEVVRTFLVPI